MDFKAIKTDPEAEQNGVWQDIGGGASLLIARYLNPKHKKAVDKRTKPYRRQIRDGSIPDEIADKLEADCMADAVLLDWQGVTDGGEPVAYSRAEAARRLFEYRDFREMVQDLARDAAAYREAEIEEAEGN